jgi:hypothetical protein
MQGARPLTGAIGRQDQEQGEGVVAADLRPAGCVGPHKDTE